MEKIEIFITLLKEHAHIDKGRSRKKIVAEDPDDDKFFHLTLESGSQYIVSRDTHLIKVKEFKGIKVLKPEVFLNALRRGSL